MPSIHTPAFATALLVFIAPVLVQCDRGTPTSQSADKKSKSQRPAAPPAVAIPVEVRADGLAYRPGESTPFTGEAIELHPDVDPPAVVRRIPYVDGKKHGAVTRWTPKGKQLEDRRYDHGVPQSCLNFHSNGERKIQVVLNAHDKAEGPYFRWHDNGVLQVESAFDSEERFHGEEKIYDREGKLVGHYRNEHGKFMEVIFETPEEKARRLAHWAELEKAAAQAKAEGGQR
ncbi:MAG: toxin-antitoxin system YwqK family antitoxin [Verrucomicrobiales bacterium]